MENKDLLAIIGDLYLKTYMLGIKLEQKEKELSDLKAIILTLQNNGTVSS